MVKLPKNKIFEKIFYWVSALSILVAIPLITIFILRLGTIFNPFGLLIKVLLYLFIGGVTLVGFIAIFLFFYETLLSKFFKKSNKNFNK
tara:strand:+ start:1383 stop:1649 length:267 start_codon:yes stop_codon:yes gene_type:complete